MGGYLNLISLYMLAHSFVAIEFASSIIIGVVCVTVLSVLFVPHWTAAFYVGAVMSIVTLDLLGFMQFFGVTVGPVSYVICVMSIGLMVDHVLHVVVRYMEIPSKDRKLRTQETLETIGSSLMLGGKYEQTILSKTEFMV